MVDNILESWRLSRGAIAVLDKEPEITQRLSAARSIPPFPPGYMPKVIEVLYDDLVFIRLEDGYLRYLRPCDESYEPPFTEVRFDDQTALFMVGSETVMNRISAMAALDKILGI